MPFDNFRKQVDHQERPDPFIFQDPRRRVTQAQSAYHDVQFAIESGKAQVRELPFTLGKKAGHQVFVAKLNFKHLSVLQPGFRSPAKRQFAQRRLVICELLYFHFLDFPALKILFCIPIVPN
jgi:hypothetical protein